MLRCHQSQNQGNQWDDNTLGPETLGLEQTVCVEYPGHEETLIYAVMVIRKYPSPFGSHIPMI